MNCESQSVELVDKLNKAKKFTAIAKLSSLWQTQLLLNLDRKTQFSSQSLLRIQIRQCRQDTLADGNYYRFSYVLNWLEGRAVLWLTGKI